jgi:hypothetical protein
MSGGVVDSQVIREFLDDRSGFFWTAGFDIHA